MSPEQVQKTVEFTNQRDAIVEMCSSGEEIDPDQLVEATSGMFEAYLSLPDSYRKDKMYTDMILSDGYRGLAVIIKLKREVPQDAADVFVITAREVLNKPDEDSGYEPAEIQQICDKMVMIQPDSSMAACVYG